MVVRLVAYFFGPPCIAGKREQMSALNVMVDSQRHCRRDHSIKRNDGAIEYELHVNNNANATAIYIIIKSVKNICIAVSASL